VREDGDGGWADEWMGLKLGLWDWLASSNDMKLHNLMKRVKLMAVSLRGI
jgi:hypothetical protein